LDEHWQGRTIAVMLRHTHAGDIGAPSAENAGFVGIQRLEGAIRASVIIAERSRGLTGDFAIRPAKAKIQERRGASNRGPWY
jgi:hypothetical protein